MIALSVLLSACTSSLPSGERVCGHVVELLERELGPSSGVNQAEIDEIVVKCINDAKQQKLELPPKTYSARMRCAMAATRLDELMKCEELGEDAPSPAPAALPEPSLEPTPQDSPERSGSH